MAEHCQRLIRHEKSPQMVAVVVGRRNPAAAYHLGDDETCYAEPVPAMVRQRQHDSHRERALKQLLQLGFAETPTELELAA